jgi:hypothetical protein
VVTLLIDAPVDGHAEVLAMRLSSETWREFSAQLNIQFVHLEQVGLDRTAKDDAVWRVCQTNGYYLLTANRNLESDDSLEATIRREGKADSLPVFSFADADRIYQSTVYLDEVVEALLDYLLDEAELSRDWAALFAMSRNKRTKRGCN